MPEFTPISKDEVPAYNLIQTLDKWVPEFLESEKLIAEIVALREKRTLIKKSDPTEEDVLAAAKEDYQAYRQQRIRRLSDRLAAGRGRALKFFRHDDIQPLVLWDEIAEAIKVFSPSLAGGVSEKIKKSQIGKINDDIEKIISRLRSKNDPRYFVIADNGQVTTDRRGEFVSRWFKTQRKIYDKCNVRGIALKNCTDQERRAYGLLGIDKAINRDSDFCAYDK